MSWSAWLTSTIRGSSNSGRIVRTRGKICTAGKTSASLVPSPAGADSLKIAQTGGVTLGMRHRLVRNPNRSLEREGQRFDSKNDSSTSVLNRVPMALGIETLSFQFLDERGPVQLQELGRLTGHAVGFAKRLPD